MYCGNPLVMQNDGVKQTGRLPRARTQEEEGDYLSLHLSWEKSATTRAVSHFPKPMRPVRLRVRFCRVPRYTTANHTLFTSTTSKHMNWPCTKMRLAMIVGRLRDGKAQAQAILSHSNPESLDRAFSPWCWDVFHMLRILGTYKYHIGVVGPGYYPTEVVLTNIDIPSVHSQRFPSIIQRTEADYGHRSILHLEDKVFYSSLSAPHTSFLCRRVQYRRFLGWLFGHSHSPFPSHVADGNTTGGRVHGAGVLYRSRLDPFHDSQHSGRDGMFAAISPPLIHMPGYRVNRFKARTLPRGNGDDDGVADVCHTYHLDSVGTTEYAVCPLVNIGSCRGADASDHNRMPNLRIAKLWSLVYGHQSASFVQAQGNQLSTTDHGPQTESGSSSQGFGNLPGSIREANLNREVYYGCCVRNTLARRHDLDGALSKVAPSPSPPHTTSSSSSSSSPLSIVYTLLRGTETDHVTV
ncbi:hypothetical protein CCUS01_05734 [Colletotrichum cuscutae]|uniref:Uncharacterized protein n=1 Tax=Colletotrichum cuscutae TaxID=1209917 RepID=A0AAI9Y1P6_9PEZI|nr:hypothetical protein CCUS01_05734 [Colletotrichum cuscutae]